MTRKTFIAVALAFLFLISSLPVQSQYTANQSTPLPGTSRPPISINGDAQFTLANGVVSGSGTPSDPYIIEGWEIDASGGHGISISFTTAHAIIRNCVIFNGNVSYNYGIYFNVVSNIIIENCTLDGNLEGIYLNQANNVAIINNTIQFSTLNGIYADMSGNILIKENTIIGSGIASIKTVDFHNGEITYNYILSHLAQFGIRMSSSSLNNISYNLLEYGGQSAIYLTNSPSNILEFNEIRWSAIGAIAIHFSPFNVIKHNALFANPLGMQLFYSSDLVIENNEILSSSTEGIYAMDSLNASIRENAIENTLQIAIRTSNLNNSFIESNIIKHAGWNGIKMEHSFDNAVRNNSISFVDIIAVYLSHSNANEVLNNSINGTRTGFMLTQSEDNAFHNNTMTTAGFWIEYSENITISTTNVNHLGPILYYQDAEDVYLDSIANVGQIIFNNISRGGIAGMNINNSNFGIMVLNSEDILIRNNTLSLFTVSGIRVFASENSTVQWNTVTSSAFGIEIVESSDLAVVQNNTVLQNSFGFTIQDSNNLVIRYNRIGENSEGARLSNVGFSLIYGNTFYNNTVAQAIDSGGINNTWYYMQTGNMWADYRNQYPNATNDGRVWNSPYDVLGYGFIDLYPLVYSIIWVEGLNPPPANHSNPPPGNDTNPPPQNQTRTDDPPANPADPAPPSDISIPGFDILILAAVSIGAILIVAKQIVKNKGRKRGAFQG